MTRVSCVLVAALALTATPRASAQSAPIAAPVAVDPARTPDAAFVAKAADATALDSELATLGSTRAVSTDVKALARRVVDSRTALAHDLAAMADTRQLTAASALGDSPKPVTPTPSPVAALRATSRGAFDAAFVTALLANGEAMVALFDAESRDGRDDEIKEWAARQLPALRDHVTAVRALRPRPGS